MVTSMFYNRTEIGERIGWTFQCNGVATIISGFLAFGVAHSNPEKKPARWQLLFIVYMGLTFLLAIWFLTVFPDSPVKARFLTKDEKVKAVRRISSNQVRLRINIKLLRIVTTNFQMFDRAVQRQRPGNMNKQLKH